MCIVSLPSRKYNNEKSLLSIGLPPPPRVCVLFLNVSSDYIWRVIYCSCIVHTRGGRVQEGKCIIWYYNDGEGLIESRQTSVRVPRPKYAIVALPGGCTFLRFGNSIRTSYNIWNFVPTAPICLIIYSWEDTCTLARILSYTYYKKSDLQRVFFCCARFW